MIKRLVLIAFFTGTGQLFSVFSLKFIATKISLGSLSALGQMDALLQLSLNIIGLGLQSAVMRDMALKSDWHGIYSNAQSARMVMGLLLMPLSFFAFFNNAYLIFLIAPLLAASGDYALYAVGYSVKGSIMACLRVLVPYGLIAVIAVSGVGNIGMYFIAGLFIAYFISNIIIGYYLKAPLLYKPLLQNFIQYFKTLNLGLVNLSFYFIGLGLLLVIPYFYNEHTTAIAFLGIKVYVVLKGVLRIMHQAFLRDMIRDEVCLKVDELSLLVTAAYLGAVLVFPGATIQLLFGEAFMLYKSFFIYLGIAIMLYAFNLSLTTRAMLDRKDKRYTIVTTFAAIITGITTIAFSYYNSNVYAIGVSLIFGEMLFCLGLMFFMGYKNIFIPRFLFVIQCAIIMAPVFLIRYFFGDTLMVCVSSLTFYTLIILLIHQRKKISFNN
jgi:hypothetical protein